jgi:hypothetical protein
VAQSVFADAHRQPKRLGAAQSCAFTATWMGQENDVDVKITPDKRDAGQYLPLSHFGNGILTWNLPLLFRTPPGYNLLVRGPANYPKDAVSH